MDQLNQSSLTFKSLILWGNQRERGLYTLVFSSFYAKSKHLRSSSLIRKFEMLVPRIVIILTPRPLTRLLFKRFHFQNVSGRLRLIKANPIIHFVRRVYYRRCIIVRRDARNERGSVRLVLSLKAINASTELFFQRDYGIFRPQLDWKKRCINICSRNKQLFPPCMSKKKKK